MALSRTKSGHVVIWIEMPTDINAAFSGLKKKIENPDDPEAKLSLEAEIKQATDSVAHMFSEEPARRTMLATYAQ